MPSMGSKTGSNDRIEINLFIQLFMWFSKETLYAFELIWIFYLSFLIKFFAIDVTIPWNILIILFLRIKMEKIKHFYKLSKTKKGFSLKETLNWEIQLYSLKVRSYCNFDKIQILI